MAPSGPTVNRRQVGAELRRWREQTDPSLKIEDAARHLGCSTTRISRIETSRGTAVLKADDIRKLAELYGVTDQQKIQQLLNMLANSQREGWWEAYGHVLPPGLAVYVGLEADARAERAWEPLLVHGLLQTPDYARAVFSSWGTNRPGDIDDLIHVRTQRQQALTRSGNPLELWAVLDEGVVRRPVGGRDTMRGQLQHLVAVAEMPNVTIQVLPTARGSHPGLDGAFSILDFETDPAVVYVEGPAGNLYLERKLDVRRVTNTYDLLRAMALAPDESTALLSRIVKET